MTEEAFGLSGVLTEGAVTAMLEALARARRSGTLYLSAGEERGWIVLSGGDITAAFAPAEPSLFEALLAADAVTQDEAARRAERPAGARPLLAALVDEGSVELHDLLRIARWRLRRAAEQLARWRDGAYLFSPNEERADPDADGLPPIHVPVAELAPPSPSPVRAAQAPEILLWTADQRLAQKLAPALSGAGYPLSRPASLDETAALVRRASGHEAALIADLHLSAEESGRRVSAEELLIRLKRAFPEVAILALGHQVGDAQLLRLYGAGVRAVLPRPSPAAGRISAAPLAAALLAVLGEMRRERARAAPTESGASRLTPELGGRPFDASKLTPGG